MGANFVRLVHTRCFISSLFLHYFSNLKILIQKSDLSQFLQSDPHHKSIGSTEMLTQ